MVDTNFDDLDWLDETSPQLGPCRNIPYPVDELMTIYLPTWFHRFINDLWSTKVTTNNRNKIKKTVKKIKRK